MIKKIYVSVFQETWNDRQVILNEGEKMEIEENLSKINIKPVWFSSSPKEEEINHFCEECDRCEDFYTKIDFLDTINTHE